MNGIKTIFYCIFPTLCALLKMVIYIFYLQDTYNNLFFKTGYNLCVPVLGAERRLTGPTQLMRQIFSLRMNSDQYGHNQFT